MSNLIKIYQVTCTKGFIASIETGTGFSLKPWEGDNIDYEGYDNGGLDYILPDGYNTGFDDCGQPHIYDSKDNYCELVSVNGNPAIVTGDPLPMILKHGK